MPAPLVPPAERISAAVRQAGVPVLPQLTPVQGLFISLILGLCNKTLSLGMGSILSLSLIISQFFSSVPDISQPFKRSSHAFCGATVM